MRVARKRDGISRKVPERLSFDVANGNMMWLVYPTMGVLSKNSDRVTDPSHLPYPSTESERQLVLIVDGGDGKSIHGCLIFFLRLLRFRFPEQPGANMIGDRC